MFQTTEQDQSCYAATWNCHVEWHFWRGSEQKSPQLIWLQASWAGCTTRGSTKSILEEDHNSSILLPLALLEKNGGKLSLLQIASPCPPGGSKSKYSGKGNLELAHPILSTYDKCDRDLFCTKQLLAARNEGFRGPSILVPFQRRSMAEGVCLWCLL